MLAGSRMCRWAHQVVGHPRQALLADAHRPHRCCDWHSQHLLQKTSALGPILEECSIKVTICSKGYDETCDMLCLSSMMYYQRLGNSEPSIILYQTAL